MIVSGKNTDFFCVVYGIPRPFEPFYTIVQYPNYFSTSDEQQPERVLAHESEPSPQKGP